MANHHAKMANPPRQDGEPTSVVNKSSNKANAPALAPDGPAELEVRLTPGPVAAIAAGRRRKARRVEETRRATLAKPVR